MTFSLDSPARKIVEIGDTLSEQVTRKLHESVDFAKRHEPELLAAGLVIVASTAIACKTGAITKLLDALSPALGKVAGEEIAGDATKFSAGALKETNAGFLKNVNDFVFDLDHTLVPTNDAYAVHEAELTRQLVKHTGLSEPFVSAAVKETAGKMNIPLVADHLELIKPIQDLYPGINLNEHFPDIAPAVRQAYRATLKPHPDVVKLFDYLHSQGKSIHIFTDSPASSGLDRVDASGLGKYVTNVFTGARDPLEANLLPAQMTDETLLKRLVELKADRPKLDGSGYRDITRMLKLDPQNALMTGDTNLLDVAQAKQAGMRTAQANWFRQNEQTYAIPDLTLESPEQLRELVELNK
jgi:FMN phosphatase YigB (HAD superfamily)